MKDTQVVVLVLVTHSQAEPHENQVEQDSAPLTDQHTTLPHSDTLPILSFLFVLESCRVNWWGCWVLGHCYGSCHWISIRVLDRQSHCLVALHRLLISLIRLFKKTIEHLWLQSLMNLHRLSGMAIEQQQFAAHCPSHSISWSKQDQTQ